MPLSPLIDRLEKSAIAAREFSVGDLEVPVHAHEVMELAEVLGPSSWMDRMLWEERLRTGKVLFGGLRLVVIL